MVGVVGWGGERVCIYGRFGLVYRVCGDGGWRWELGLGVGRGVGLDGSVSDVGGGGVEEGWRALGKDRRIGKEIWGTFGG